MTHVVVDASALLEYLLRTPRGLKLTFILQAAATELHTPALADVEVASGLIRLLVRKMVLPERVGEVLTDLMDLPLTRHGHLALLPRAIALRNNFSVYDAVYVALAESVQATLVTADEKLAGAVRQHLSLEVVSA